MVDVHQIWVGPASDVPVYVGWSMATWQRHHPHRHTVWTYDRAIEVPANTRVADANQLLPEAEFRRLVARCDHRLSPHQRRAVACDHLRLRLLDVLLRRSASADLPPPADAVAYVDADVLALRPLPVPDSTQGAIFTCNPAKRTGAMASQRRETADAATTPHAPATDEACFTQLDGRDHFSNSIMILRRDHAPCRRFVDQLLSQRACTKYNAAMYAANEVRRQLCLGVLLPAARVHPLPWFSLSRLSKRGSAAGFTTYGTRTPSASAILQHAFTVELYGSQLDPALLVRWRQLPADAMLRVLLAHILAGDGSFF